MSASVLLHLSNKIYVPWALKLKLQSQIFKQVFIYVHDHINTRNKQTANKISTIREWKKTKNNLI